MSQASRAPDGGHSRARRIAGQGALLFSGFALAQALSFARNAIIAYWLSKGDFGIAATITLALQLLDQISDLGADRLIVQADDGDEPAMAAVAHTTLLLRGGLTAAVLYLAAGPMTRFFHIEDARWAFELAAFVPLIKGFLHLDSRRLQRRLDNRQHMAVEIAPQAAALLLAPAALYLTPSYAAVLWLALAQAVLAVVTSHAVAERGYNLGFNHAIFRHLISFGWPIWLSAFPLIAVFHGDRMIVGRVFGMETLAGYTAAFMVTMVPGLIAAKVGHALMLPLFAEARNTPAILMARLRIMTEVVVLGAAAYLVVFVVAGGDILPIAFGPSYTDLGSIIGWLSLMWALRMVQAVPGMILMAHGETRPLLAAGTIRALALLLAVAAVALDLGLVGIAAAGSVGELLSLLYLLRSMGRRHPGFPALFLGRLAFLLPASAAAIAVRHILPEGDIMLSLPVAMLTLAIVVLGAVALLPTLRAAGHSLLHRNRAGDVAGQDPDQRRTASMGPAGAGLRPSSARS